MLPAFPVFNYCRFIATSTGTGAFVVASAAPTDSTGFTHATPATCKANNGALYRYNASSADGSQTETGAGIYTTASSSLSRAVILDTSVGTLTPVNFTTIPIVDVFPSADVTLDVAVIPPVVDIGTLMLFQQTSAPTGWTKQVTHNDKTLRVVSGTASSGGSNAFSTVMAQTVVGSHTNSLAETISHAHAGTGGGFFENTGASNQSPVANCSAGFPYSFVGATAANGSSGAHNHTITMAMQYVDIIICSKV